jgi:hypothetical protein
VSSVKAPERRRYRVIGSYWPTTPAEPGVCGWCASALLVGQVEGAVLRADAVAVTLLGELVAYVNGRLTFELRNRELWHRTLERIRAGNKGPIVVQHKCGYPPPQIYRAPVPAMQFNAPIGGVDENEFPF